jgi:hypothetical protein
LGFRTETRIENRVLFRGRLNLESILAFLQPAYLASAVIGYLLLRVFTAHAGVQMPDADGSLIVVVAICGLFCLFGAAWLAMVPLIPMWFVYDPGQPYRLVPLAERYPAETSPIKVYIRRFLLMFLPYIIGTITLPLIVSFLIYVHPDAFRKTETFNRYLNWSFAGSACLGIMTSCLCAYFYSRAGEIFATARTGKLRRVPFIITSLLSSTFLWFSANALLFIGLFLGIREKVLPDDASAHWLIVFYLGIVLWHCLSMSLVLWQQYEGAIAVGALIYISIILIFGGQLAALSRRAAGIGGGILISGCAKIVDAGSPSLAIRTKHFQGCLVLRTGTKTIFQRVTYDTDKIESCHLNPQTPVEEEPGELVRTEIDTIKVFGKDWPAVQYRSRWRFSGWAKDLCHAAPSIPPAGGALVKRGAGIAEESEVYRGPNPIAFRLAAPDPAD